MHDLLSVPLGRRAALRRIGYALGGIATAPLASGLLAGCRTPGGDDLAAYSFQTLSDGQQRSLAALVDQILPATETPGAAEVGVPQFVDTMLSEWYAPEERDAFLAGLAEVDRQAGGSVADLDPDAQASLVAALDAAAFAPAPEPTPEADPDVASAAQEGTYQTDEQAEREVAGMQGDLGDAQSDSAAAAPLNTGEGTVSAGEPDAAPPFFRQLKELAVAGYYTSEVGATEELRWVAAPGRYDPDVPLAEAGRAWA